MIRFTKAFLLAISMGCMLFAQNPATPPATSTSSDNKSAAYYNFAMGRMYLVMANSEGKTEYIAKAAEHYEQALKLDPKSGTIFEELTDLYIQTSRLRDAVTLAENLLQTDPQNLDARRMLGRVYTRMAGESRSGRIDEQYLKLAIEQYEKVTSKDAKDADSWVMLGRLYGFSNKSVEAEKALNTALQLEPDNEEALTQLALVYVNLGDSKRAIEKLKAVTEKSPNERALLILADQYKQNRDFKSAAEVLRKALEMQPENPSIARELATNLMYDDQLDEALSIFQKLSVQDPRDASLSLSLVEIYRAKRDLVKAREAMNQAKSVDPRSYEVRFQDVRLLEAEGKTTEALTGIKALIDDTARKSYSEAEAGIRAGLLDEYGILLRSEDQYPQAIEAFKQMGALSGDDGKRGKRAAVQIIDTHRQAKDYIAALREAEAALKKYPGDRMVKLERAIVLADTGKVDESAAELRSMLSGEGQREVFLRLAQIYEKSKRYADMAKALDEWQKLPDAKEDSETIHFMRGAMYERMKKYDASEEEFRKVLAMNADNPGALNYLGYMLADRNVRLDEAQTMIRKALELDPDNGAYLDSLGWVYYRQGKFSEAEGMLVKALGRKDMEKDPTVHDHLADVYFKQGKIREAIAQWQASIKQYQAAPSEADPEDVAKVNRKLDEARVRLAQETKRQK